MLLCDDGDAVICIGQPSHAWLSGQLARVWGNARFGGAEPYEDVCLAAEQHDVGMTDWDLAPTLNPQTGRPRSFMDMELDTHLALWTGAPRRLLAQNRYAALLVSLHGTALYARRDLSGLPADDAAAIRAYLDGQRALQRDLLSALRGDPATVGWADDATVARNQQLLWTWDSLSLALLLRWAPFTLRAVPTAEGPLDTALESSGDGFATLDPWPFAVDEVHVRAEGRQLTERFDDEHAMRDALDRAPWVTVQIALAKPAPRAAR